MVTENSARAELRLLADRSRITAVLVRYARGVDRRDASLLRSCFHEDAVEEHGTFSGRAWEFVDFVMPRLSRFEMTSHNLCNMWIEVRGGMAVSETYLLALHVYAAGEDGTRKPDLVLTGRYIDRFERRGRQWKIAHRQFVCDYVRECDHRAMGESALGLDRMLRQRPDQNDFVYTRWAQIVPAEDHASE